MSESTQLTRPASELARIVLGVTGGIAAYKSAELLRLLVKAGIAVDVVMTDAATKFVTPMTFQALSGRAVLTDLWESGAANAMGHIAVSRGADAILVAPASADFLAKLAQGRADDLLSTLCLARECPLLVAPAMNRQMWANKATQRNVKQLAQDGVAILGPDNGELACNENGDGRMLEPEALFAALVASRQPKVLAGKRVLLTAGPTFEAIDPVRGITNSSSGKMGFAMAQAAAEGRRAGDSGRRADFHGDARRALRASTSPVPRRWRKRCSGASIAPTSSSPWRRWPTMHRKRRPTEI
jgi:phosphopantothenoylcysteine decarboxylase/phosphopantothenate--cysteine ligase